VVAVRVTQISVDAAEPPDPDPVGLELGLDDAVLADTSPGVIVGVGPGGGELDAVGSTWHCCPDALSNDA
jgi:hypothetical protein